MRQAEPSVRQLRSAPAFPVTWFAILVAYSQYPNAIFGWFVDHRIWKDPQRVDSARQIKWRAKAWIFDKQLGHAFKLRKKSTCYEKTAALPIESCCLGQISRRFRMNRVAHRSAARNWARTTSPAMT